MDGPELERSRRLIVAGLALTVAGEVVLFWPRHGTAGWLGYRGPMWLGLAALVVPFLQHRSRTVAARRALGLRLIETSRGLATATTRSTAGAAVAIFASFFLYVLPVAWWQGYDVDPTHARTDLIFNVVTTVFLVVALFVLGAAVAVAWRGIATELSPVGVRTVGPLFVRLIPWQALVPGAPLRPAMTDNWLVLNAARPELIEQRGFSLGGLGLGVAAFAEGEPRGERAPVADRRRDPLVCRASGGA
jgi:hypothetical protein